MIGPCFICDGAFCLCDNNFRVITISLFKLKIKVTIKIILLFEKILRTDGQTEVGKLTKEYAGFENEAFTTADNFSITCNNKIIKTFINFNI